MTEKGGMDGVGGWVCVCVWGGDACVYVCIKKEGEADAGMQLKQCPLRD